MKVELDLGVAPFLVFTVVPELEVEVAAGTYVKQSQVRIMSAVASGLEKTRVDIFVVPLGDKFDNMTAFLIYERFWQKKVPINSTVFGDYDVIYIQYPGNDEYLCTPCLYRGREKRVSILLSLFLFLWYINVY